MPTESTPCVFFDRDGIVNREPEEGRRYITRPEEFHLIPEVVAAMRVGRARGYACVVVTNQKCVHRGIVSEATLAEIHQRMRDLLAEHGVGFDAVYYCPHGDDECDCRKPLPGMLLRASRERGLDLSASWMLGDNPRDCEAGKRAGCAVAVLVNPTAASPAADHVVPGMAALPGLLEEKLPVI